MVTLSGYAAPSEQKRVIAGPKSQKKSRPDRVASGTLWPNGEFSLGWPKEKLEGSLEPQWGGWPKFDLESLESETRREFWAIREGLGQLAAAHVCVRLLRLKSPLGLLGLSLVRNSHTGNTRPATYGRKGITGYGKKMVRCAASQLQEECPHRTLTFLTLTVPPMPVLALKAVAKNWGQIVNRLYQWIHRKLELKGLRKSICGCTEVQPKRLESEPLGSLHLHLVFQGKKYRYQKGWAVTCEAVKTWWLSQLERITGYKCINANPEHLCCVTKNAAGYLGKYMSKGSLGASKVAEAGGWECVPRQWWNLSADLRESVKSAVKKGPQIGVLLDMLVHQYFSESEQFPGVLFSAHINHGGVELLAGFYGRLSKTEHEGLTALLELN